MDYLGLAALVFVLWVSQGVFAYIQNRDMTKRLVEIKTNNVGNHLGIGITKARFNAGRGVIVIVVTDPEGIVKDFDAISGYTIAARFKSKKEYLGKPAAEVASLIKDKRLFKSFNQAIEKINEEREKNGYPKIEFINN